MSDLTVTFTRAGLGLGPLVVDSNPTASLYLPEDGVGAVGWDLRRTYAPDSPWVPGKMLLAAVREASTLPLTIYARGASAAEVDAARKVLEDAAAQWSYTVEVNLLGETFRAEPAIPQWAAMDSGMVAEGLDRCQLVIPVNP